MFVDMPSRPFCRIVGAKTGTDKKKPKSPVHCAAIAQAKQGEWFFIPALDVQVDEKLILSNEPIRRGGGKPHVCEQLCRCSLRRHTGQRCGGRSSLSPR